MNTTAYSWFALRGISSPHAFVYNCTLGVKFQAKIVKGRFQPDRFRAVYFASFRPDQNENSLSLTLSLPLKPTRFQMTFQNQT